MAGPKKIPITRINKFFSEEDFNLDISMGREAIEGDGNFIVILYRVDNELTMSDDIYGEAAKGEIRFKQPIELYVMPVMGPPENKTFNDGKLRYLQDGQLTFSIYDKHLQELKVDISYGDYIGYPVTETEVRFFSVVNDGRKNYNNENTIMGYRGAFRTIVCAPVDDNEFNGE